MAGLFYFLLLLPIAWHTNKTMDEQKQVIGVAEYLDYLNLVLDKTADVQVQGEITQAKSYPSGIYFSLKDTKESGVLSCFLPIYTYRGLGLTLEEGMNVRVEGVPRLVKRSGRFQLQVDSLDLVGQGTLKAAYDALKLKLQTEGLLDRKRELPPFIRKIAVVTSKAGAVIHDFRQNIHKRGFEIDLYDVRVEGASAVKQIVHAIERVGERAHEYDVLVVMRGGGSLEDLQPFNTEVLVRSIFASPIATLVAIGHDSDVPLAQLVADCQVSTPTAAAHLVNKSWDPLVDAVRVKPYQLDGLFGDVLQEVNLQLSHAKEVLSQEVTNLVSLPESFSAKLKQAVLVTSRGFLAAREKSRLAEAVFAARDPVRLLNLGYAIVTNKEGKVVRSKKQIKSGDNLSTQISDGSIHSQVT